MKPTINKIIFFTIRLIFFNSIVLANTTSFLYDFLHRLTHVINSNSTSTIYNYDEVENRSSKVVTSSATLSIHFTVAPTTGETPCSTTFTDQFVGNITSWLWDFGDGNANTEQDTSGSCSYTVKLLESTQIVQQFALCTNVI